MLSVPHRAIDNKFLANIEGYKGKNFTQSFMFLSLLNCVNFQEISTSSAACSLTSGGPSSTKKESQRNDIYFYLKHDYSSVKYAESPTIDPSSFSRTSFDFPSAKSSNLKRSESN